MDLALNNLQRFICYKTQTTNQQVKSYQRLKKMVLDASLLCVCVCVCAYSLGSHLWVRSVLRELK